MLIAIYSQLLHSAFLYFQVNFQALPAIIGLIAGGLSYLTTILVIWIDPPDVGLLLVKRKINKQIARLTMQCQCLADSDPKKQEKLGKIHEYQQTLDELYDKEIQSSLN
ncbi:hypothetical protein L4F91_06855 [Avibacterium sp. 20-126]|uniref:hypothetical protein n=1 Tax=Avibacterium sp. 20-126 TaxID=2911524 RepID=UPI00218507C0|nr:hypothetical protein L4F91_06855 [Avibacterium sp. 20-126]